MKKVRVNLICKFIIAPLIVKRLTEKHKYGEKIFHTNFSLQGKNL